MSIMDPCMDEQESNNIILATDSYKVLICELVNILKVDNNANTRRES